MSVKNNIEQISLAGAVNLNEYEDAFYSYSQPSFKRKNGLFVGDELKAFHKAKKDSSVIGIYKDKLIKREGDFLITYNNRQYQLPDTTFIKEEIDYKPSTESKACRYYDGLIITPSGYPTIDIGMQQNGYVSFRHYDSLNGKEAYVVSYVTYGTVQLTKQTSYIAYNDNTYTEIPYSLFNFEQGVAFRLFQRKTGSDTDNQHRSLHYLAYAENLDNLDIFNPVRNDSGYLYPSKTGTTANYSATYGWVACGEAANTGVERCVRMYFNLGISTQFSEDECYITTTPHYMFLEWTVSDQIGGSGNPFSTTYSSNSKIAVKTSRCMLYGSSLRNNVVSSDSFWDTGKRSKELTDLCNVQNHIYAGGLQCYIKNSVFKLGYYNNILDTICYGSSILDRNIQSVEEANNSYIIYKQNDRYYKITASGKENLTLKHIDRFVLANTASRLTSSVVFGDTIDLDEETIITRSNSYNEDVILRNGVYDSLWKCSRHILNYYTFEFKTGSQSIFDHFDEIQDSTDENVQTFAFQYATGINSDYYAKDKSWFSTVYPVLNFRGSLFISKTNSIISDKKTYDDFMNSMTYYHIDTARYPVDVYLPKQSGGVPFYKTTLGSNEMRDDHDMSYPSGNIDYNITLTDSLTDTLTNQMTVRSGLGSSITSVTSSFKPALGYYMTNSVELDKMFIINGTWYACNDDYIFEVGLDDSRNISYTSLITRKKNMKLIGVNMNQAYFYSLFDHYIYVFTGDRNMSQLMGATRIGDVYEMTSKPENGFSAFTTDKGVVVIYNGQISLVEDVSKTISLSDTMMMTDGYVYSLDCKDNYVRDRLVVETMPMSLGSETKSLNDCIYIRVRGEGKGTITVSSYTINDVKKESDRKSFDLNITKGFEYVRYQPRWQDGVAFSFRIESDFPVTSLSLGHKASVSGQPSGINI